MTSVVDWFFPLSFSLVGVICVICGLISPLNLISRGTEPTEAAAPLTAASGVATACAEARDGARHNSQGEKCEKGKHSTVHGKAS